MEATCIRGGSVLSGERLRALDVLVEDGRIASVAPSLPRYAGVREIDARGLVVLPGFIDLHTHGAVNVDVNAADAEGLREVGRFLASHGVTSWQCSVLTDTPEQTERCCREARSVIEAGPYEGAELAGVHLEGPCLSVEYKGAMPEHLLMHRAEPALFERYQRAAAGHVTYVTLAPEIPGAVKMVPELTRLGMVVAMGHSAATYDVACAAADAGVRSVTHLGNAMRLFHQHEPAIFGAALQRDDLCVEAICDGRHLVPAKVRLYVAAKGWDRVVAVSDSIMAAGLPDGSYKLGVNDVVVKDGDAKLADTGVRAGSTLTLDRALANVCAFCETDVAHAARLMTANPARLMGWGSKGVIECGRDADLVLLDESLQVVRTIVGGRTVFEA